MTHTGLIGNAQYSLGSMITQCCVSQQAYSVMASKGKSV